MKKRLFLLPVGILFLNIIYAQELERGFQTPPITAKPQTWWHWTKGNVTYDGITKDLEWMKKSGLGGFHLSDVNFGIGQTTDDKIMFGSPEWLKAVEYATKEAERLNLEMAIFSSAGWSLAGGPWVEPKQAMKKFVWSKTSINDPREYSGQLPSPPSNVGPVRNMKRSIRSNDNDTFYNDNAVIAYPTPEDELYDQQKPIIKVNGNTVNSNQLIDDDLNSSLTIKLPEEKQKIVIEFQYEQPYKAQAFSIASFEGIPVGQVYASKDGKQYNPLITLPGPQLYRGGKVRTFAFPETTARFFRVELTGAPLKPSEVMEQPMPSPVPDSIQITEMVFHSGARVHRWEDKAGYSFLFDYSSVKSPEVAKSSVIDRNKIIDLTEKMDDQGSLHWNVPAGNWTILRTGYSLTGAKNRPAVPSGLGYEVDKLSREHVQAYLQHYIGMLKEQLGPLLGERLKYLMLDSWEAGMQNWTEKMPGEFQKRRGYSMLPYLPVLAGYVVESSDVSDRFLWDFRRTLADMFAENFYQVVSQYVHKYGMETFGEASGVSLEILEDALLCKKYIDIPMGEFWVRDLHPSSMYYEDVRGAASAAHAYGKKIIAAEAFTGGNYESPFNLKRISDYWFTQGINRIVFHTSAHQPFDSKPGNTMVGTHIHRNITWAGQAEPFITYLSRISFLLQQGLFVADFAYLLDEGAPSTMPFWGVGIQPEVPDGYDYDYVNTDVLMNRMSVDDNGDIVLPDGMRYHMLILPGNESMNINILKKLYNMVQAGATIYGPKPFKTNSLSDFPQSENEMVKFTTELWGDLDGINKNVRYLGKGKVIWGEPLQEALQKAQIEKDVIYSRNLNTQLSWIHRKVNNMDLYFISNQANQEEQIQMSFRISGKEAELWYPGDGSMKKASYEMVDGRTVVPLNLSPYEALFVVFRNKTEEKKRVIPKSRLTIIKEVDDPWTVKFPENWGAPERITMDSLYSWTEHNQEGIKYFSGTVTYQNTIKMEAKEINKGNSVWIDLGTVKDLAQVYLNGELVQTLWKSPYRIEITKYLKKGENELRIDVTNQWTNRLAGDALLPGDKKILDEFVPMFMGKYTLQESGLIGPVNILTEESIK